MSSQHNNKNSSAQNIPMRRYFSNEKNYKIFNYLTRDSDGLEGKTSIDINTKEGRELVKDKIIIGSVCNASPTNAKEFYAVCEPCAISDLISTLNLSGVEFNFDEVITGTRPEKMRFDIDLTSSENLAQYYGVEDPDDVDEWKIAFHQILYNKFCEAIFICFSVHYGLCPIIDIYTSIGYTDDINVKLSAHLVIRNMMCENSMASRDAAKNFICHISSPGSEPFHPDEIKAIDCQIYKNNAGLRTLYSTKNERQKTYHTTYIPQAQTEKVDKWKPEMGFITLAEKDARTIEAEHRDEEIKFTYEVDEKELEIAKKWCNEQGYSLGQNIQAGFRVEKGTQNICVICGREHPKQLGYIKFTEKSAWFNCWSAIEDHKKDNNVKFGICIHGNKKTFTVQDTNGSNMWSHPTTSKHQFDDYIIHNLKLEDLPAWAIKNVAFISGGGKPYYLTRNIDKGEVVFYTTDRKNLSKIFRRWELEEEGNNKKDDKKKTKITQISLLDIISRQDVDKAISYHSVDFMPPNIGPVNNVFNTFVGFKHQALDDYDPAIIAPILNHVREVWCFDKQDVYDYLINLWAHIVQKPNIKAETALIIMSEKQGAGKGIIVDFLGHHVIGSKYYYYTENLDRLFDKFNSEHADKLLTLVDEASTTEKSVNAVSEQLKAFITRTEMWIEHKGVNKVRMNDYNNLIFATNKATPLNIDRYDRRFFVLEASDKYVGNLEYFKNLCASMTDEAGQHFFTMLMKRDISSFNPRNRPMTAIKMAMIMERLPHHLVFLIDLVRNDMPESGISESSDSFYKKYTQFCDNNNIFGKSIIAFGRLIGKIIPSFKKRVGDKTIMWREISLEKLKAEIITACNVGELDFSPKKCDVIEDESTM